MTEVKDEEFGLRYQMDGFPFPVSTIQTTFSSSRFQPTCSLSVPRWGSHRTYLSPEWSPPWTLLPTSRLWFHNCRSGLTLNILSWQAPPALSDLSNTHDSIIAMIYIYMTVCLNHQSANLREQDSRLILFTAVYRGSGIFIKYTQHPINMIERLCTWLVLYL